MVREAPPILEDVAPAEWVDDNGHMNITYYTLLVTRYLDRLVEWAQLGAGYRERYAASLFIGEAHYRYRRELLRGDRVRVTGRLVQIAGKRLEVACEIVRIPDEVVAATFAGGFINVGLANRRSLPFDGGVVARVHDLISPIATA